MTGLKVRTVTKPASSAAHERDADVCAVGAEEADFRDHRIGAARQSRQLVFRGRGIVPGRVEGEVLVSRETNPGWGGIDPATGAIIERRHELCGVCFTGKVLVFPGAKGSSGRPGFFQATRLMGTAPLAMVFTHLTTKAALGAIVTRVPTVTHFDDDPVAGIETGDRVEADGDTGLVIVHGRVADLTVARRTT